MSEKNNCFRVFVDSNVLISAVLSRQSVSHRLMERLMKDHYLVICNYTITETSRVINDAFRIRYLCGINT